MSDDVVMDWQRMYDRAAARSIENEQRVIEAVEAQDRYRIALQDVVARGLEAIHDHGGVLTYELRNEIERGQRTLSALAEFAPERSEP